MTLAFRQNRMQYKHQVHEFVKDLDYFHNKMEAVEWRFHAKQKIDEVVQLNYDLGIGPNYRVEAWSFVNAFVFVLSTTTTIGKLAM